MRLSLIWWETEQEQHFLQKIGLVSRQCAWWLGGRQPWWPSFICMLAPFCSEMDKKSCGLHEPLGLHADFHAGWSLSNQDCKTKKVVAFVQTLEGSWHDAIPQIKEVLETNNPAWAGFCIQEVVRSQPNLRHARSCASQDGIWWAPLTLLIFYLFSESSLEDQSTSYQALVTSLAWVDTCRKWPSPLATLSVGALWNEQTKQARNGYLPTIHSSGHASRETTWSGLEEAVSSGRSRQRGRLQLSVVCLMLLLLLGTIYMILLWMHPVWRVHMYMFWLVFHISLFFLQWEWRWFPLHNFSHVESAKAVLFLSQHPCCFVATVPMFIVWWRYSDNLCCTDKNVMR